MKNEKCYMENLFIILVNIKRLRLKAPAAFFLRRGYEFINDLQPQKTGRDFRADLFCSQTYCASGRRNWDPRRKLLQRQNCKRIVTSVNRALGQTEQ